MRTEEQKANLAKVLGTIVHLFNPQTGMWSAQTRRITGYHSPLVWELNRPIYGTSFYADEQVRTVNGGRVAELL